MRGRESRAQARHGPRMAKSSDLEQMTGEVIQLGSIASVDHADATCTVQLGDIETGPLPWVAQRAGGVRSWSPPTMGEQCVLLCPEGDLQNGLVLVGLYSDAHPAPSTSPDIIRLDFPDGAYASYDHAGHAWSISIPAGGTMTIDAPGGVTINGPVQINGDVTIEGTATASTDLIGGGKSLKGHKHSGVQAGSAQSGAPV